MTVEQSLLPPEHLPENTGTKQVLAAYLPTSQLNLAYMLGSNLIHGPAGFGSKYFKDVLSDCPGWIPLFVDGVPAGAFKEATVEGSHLKVVVAEIDLRNLRGPVWVSSGSGAARQVRFPEEIDENCLVIFVPAPLPITWVSAIYIPDSVAKKKFIQDIADYGNLSVSKLPLKLKKSLFEKTIPLSWPPVLSGLPERKDEALHEIQAIGGAVAILSALANCSEDIEIAYKALCMSERKEENSPNASRHSGQTDPLVGVFFDWANLRSTDSSRHFQNQLLLDILWAVVGEQQIHARANRIGELEAILSCLNEKRKSVDDEHWKQRFEDLAKDLTETQSIGQKAITELFQKHQKPVSRALLMFFLREEPEQIWDYMEYEPNSLDLAVAALLFGAQAGWSGLQSEFTERSGLRELAAHRMATLAHQRAQTGLELGPAPAYVPSLRELVVSSRVAEKKTQRDALIKLIEKMNWRGLISSRISLEKGTYRLEVDGRGAHIHFEEVVKPPEPILDVQALCDRLASTFIPSHLDNEVRQA